MTKGKKGGKIIKLSARAAEIYRRKKSKNLKKLFKKVLTKRKCCGIILKLSQKRTARSLKIEQQERSTKQKASAKY